MRYEEAVKLLTSQAKFQIKLGLERVNKMLNILDNPQNKIKVIHIAGTNGKGSVSSILSNILKHSGYKIGLYTSPHLVKYTERINVDGLDIKEETFTKYIEEICNLANEKDIELTEFEILTVCAFKYFFDEQVDIAIIETGLGGRLDATNTVNSPLLSIITSISLDHTDRLGNTIEKIAFEKAGIIKQNSNVIISVQNQGFKTIKKYAKRQNTTVFEVRNDIKTIFKDGQNHIFYNKKLYDFSLIGTYQNENTALVFSAIKFLQKNNISVNESAIEAGLKTVKWRARLEYIKEKNLIIDGAHNVDAAIKLKQSLDLYFPNQQKIFIYSTIDTKDYKGIAKTLFDKNDIIYYIDFNHKNAVPFDKYKKNVDWLNIKKLPKDELKNIINDKSLKIICGSLYMIGQLYYNVCS